MSLTTKTSSLFDSIIKARGVEYFNSGAVKPKVVEADVFKAEVAGSRIYDVKLLWSPSKSFGKFNLFMDCSCPYFESTDLCKHLWAAVLFANNLEFGKRADLLDEQKNHYETEYEEDGDETDNSRVDHWASHYSEPTKKPWQKVFSEVLEEYRSSMSYDRSVLDPRKERWAYYSLWPVDSYSEKGIRVEFYKKERTKIGKIGAFKSFRMKKADVSSFQDVLDQRALALLTGLKKYGSDFDYSGQKEVIVPSALIHLIIPKILETQRACFGAPLEDKFTPLKFDAEPYESNFELGLSQGPKAQLSLDAFFIKGSVKIPIKDVTHLIPDMNIFFTCEVVGSYRPSGPIQLLEHLYSEGMIICSEKEIGQFIERLVGVPFARFPEIPKSLGWKKTTLTCQPLLKVLLHSTDFEGQQSYREAEIHFKYGQNTYQAGQFGTPKVDLKEKLLLLRDIEKEENYVAGLKALTALRLCQGPDGAPLVQFIENFFNSIIELNKLGWEIQIENQRVVRNSKFDIQITSGIDWLDVEGKIDFNGETYSIPEILKNLQGRTSWIKLRSGELGLLPEEIIKKYTALKNLGEVQGDKIRFQSQQALFLDTLLNEEKTLIADRQFQNMISRLKGFEKIKMMPAPKGFKGKLRDYQMHGLSWLCFLKEYGFGGCLADDMGLGKTIQVLALLQNEKKEKALPTLIVVPKSLIYNWMNEAAKFTPALKIIVYAGQGRKELLSEIDKYDIILITYQTLRNDVQHFIDINFNYVILDEAQMIKNPSSQAAKAVKLLRAKNRLVLTGTPIENHFGDLLSIFQFLNPGLYANKNLMNGPVETINEHTLWILKGLRPFILRRTKEEVLKDLPEKTEQVLYCEMTPEQKSEYEKLKEFYRAKLKGAIEETGFAKSKIFILEALLRLRQMACHPGLIEKNRDKETSAKLDVLWEHVEEIIESSHKVLIFSQFTTFLKIVTDKLKRESHEFAYLDGKTQNREEEVARFQHDPRCKVFVISLKAGGVGLNLTAADYCFILDPWWNPAAESQAIDRAHRIGQKNKVFAYRLITKGTVEEKVLELQSKKKELSKALLASDQRFLSQLKLEDLQWILE